MTAEQYTNQLKDLIVNKGYWCNEVYDLNNKAIETFGYNKYLKLHNKVKKITALINKLKSE